MNEQNYFIFASTFLPNPMSAAPDCLEHRILQARTLKELSSSTPPQCQAVFFSNKNEGSIEIQTRFSESMKTELLDSFFQVILV